MGDKELMWALKNGDLDEVKTLLKKVRDWEWLSEWGNALSTAVCSIIKVLFLDAYTAAADV